MSHMDVTNAHARRIDPVTVNDLRVMPEFAAVLRQHRLDSIEALFAAKSDTPLDKPGLDHWRARLRVTVRDDSGDSVFYIKRYENPPARAAREASRVGVKSIAGVEWHWIEQLSLAGIPSVQAVALGEAFDGSRETRSVLVTAAVPGESMESLAPKWRQGKRSSARRWLAPVANVVSKLHRSGYVHRDLYLCHIFLNETATQDAAIRLIDLQRMLRPKWNMKRWIVKDLAALNYSAPKEAVSTADRLRWLKCYLGKTRLDAEARRLVYRVVGKTQQIARHDARRRARLHPDHREGGAGR